MTTFLKVCLVHCPCCNFGYVSTTNLGHSSMTVLTLTGALSRQGPQTGTAIPALLSQGCKVTASIGSTILTTSSAFSTVRPKRTSLGEAQRSRPVLVTFLNGAPTEAPVQ